MSEMVERVARAIFRETIKDYVHIEDRERERLESARLNAKQPPSPPEGRPGGRSA